MAKSFTPEDIIEARQADIDVQLFVVLRAHPQPLKVIHQWVRTKHISYPEFEACLKFVRQYRAVH